MNSKNPSSSTKIVFFGTGQTSLEALQALNADFDIKLVVTKPPAKNSAGKEFKNPVHEWAEKNGLGVITPASKKDLDTALGHGEYYDCLGIVLDYGMIIPENAIAVFSHGILNSHFSLLPKYRGANPIRAAILCGDKTTGITIIKITPGLDDGPILTWALADINNMNATELRSKLSDINCALLPETIRLYLAGELELVEQDPSEVSHTRKTTKADGVLDLNKPAIELAREVRAYAGWPKSQVEINGKSFIILGAKASKQVVEIGSFKVIGKELYLGCKAGSLKVIKIQPAGKAPMDAGPFINGYLK